MLLGVICLLMAVSTAQATLKIDFSQTDGAVEAGYEGYFAEHENLITFTSQSYSAFGSTITVTPTWAASAGDATTQMYLRPEWTTVEKADFLRDWIGTDTREPGDPLTLTISGLPAETYTWVSYHHDTAKNATAGYQTGLFDVTVNDAAGSATTMGVDISSSSTVAEDIVTFADVTTFTTQIKSNGSDITLVFHQQVSTPSAEAFFVMNGFEMTSLRMPKNPSPVDGATDVPRDVVLSWTPGESVAALSPKHTVFFSENFDDVNDGIGGVTQDPNVYPVGGTLHLDFGKTYYWRVDEAYSAGGWNQGDVRQFTVEPAGYTIPSEKIIATASSAVPGMGPENTVNTSGLDANDLHSAEQTDMWISGSESDRAWIEFEFDKIYKLYEMLVWNSNQLTESFVGYGCKNVTIEYSVDGNDYTTLGATHEFAQAPGTPGYAYNTTINLGDLTAKYVKLTANSNFGGLLPQYGLSEVRFLHIPLRAREPSPDSGTTDVDVDVVLDWRAGREAATHDVYLSTDEQAVIDGTAPVNTVTETNYGPLSLDLVKAYYWKVSEVNIAESPTTWDGDVWNFATREFLVVDDFESYNDLNPDDPESNRIFNTWIDGYEQPANGSIVGYAVAPFCERTIIHGDKQSMPLSYHNTGAAAYSETECTFSVSQNWTKASAATFVLYFHGTEGNTGQLYVKVNGSKVVYDGDAGDIAKVEWKQWNIDLALLGIDLQNVTKLSIGIDGNGASGTLYIDDIRLYRSAPEPEAP